MSTILNALQKQATNQAVNASVKQTNKYWKIGLLSALLMVIVLLCTLIFIVINPTLLSVLTQTQRVVTAVAVQEPSLSQQQEKLPAKAAGKIHFQTKPLPLLADKKISKDVASKTPSTTESAEQIVLSGQKKPIDASSAIDYSKVSDDLAERFKLALAMQGQDVQTDLSEESENTALIEEGSEADDGSDIQQMSSAFQEKVPNMSYDSHMYSTVAKDRWIRINGEDLKEGQFTSSGKIQVVEIQPNRTIFRLGKQSFSIESLADWKGL